MKRVLVINGPNLNLLGSREPEIYGATTLNQLENLITGWGEELGISVSCFQSNHEGAIIDRLHDSRRALDAVVINAGALTHYSYALHDAITAVALPTVEVHISNIKEREDWRRNSVIAPACDYMIRGRGIDGYRYALEYLVHHADTRPLTAAYGPGEDQVGDLLVPDGPGPHPVAVLIHGGFWRDSWTRDITEGLAIDLRSRGWATWNLEYRRVGTGGGWPVTLEDIAAGVNRLADLAPAHALDLDRVIAIGHSAGGQLALWAAARPSLPDHISGAKLPVRLRAVVALAPLSDLDVAYEQHLGDGAVRVFLQRSPEDDPGRYASSSPRRLLPLGVQQIIIHGNEDTDVPVEMSRGYSTAVREAGDSVTYRELDGVDHQSLIDPQSSAWAAVLAELEGLHEGTSAPDGTL